MKPLKLPEVHILRALVDGESHGYAIMQAVRTQSDGRVPLRTGSFYRHLARLIDAGLVAEAPVRREIEDPRRSAYYRLTADGRRALDREVRHLSALVSVLSTLRPSGPKATS